MNGSIPFHNILSKYDKFSGELFEVVNFQQLLIDLKNLLKLA